MADQMDADDRKALTELRIEVSHLIKAVENLTTKLDNQASKLDEQAKLYLTPASLDVLKGKVALLEKICFSGIGLILISVIAAVISLVIRK